MKKSATLLLLSCLNLLAAGQTPFTITPNNFPVYTLQNYNGPNNYNGADLHPAPNDAWDLSDYHGANTVQNNYQVETLPFYTQEGIDVYLSDVKGLTNTLGYNVDYEFDFNTDGVFEKGIYVPAQAYSLGAFTGNVADSITFPLQGTILNMGRQVMKFPATYSSSWNSQSRRSVDFNLTVGAAGLNNTPCKHVFTVFRRDSILGWGTMQVYANGVPSVPYNVLINRSIQYTVDSFFVGGAPAPPALLNVFGISQAQQTDLFNRHTAFREGYSMPLAVAIYPNVNFATPSQVFVETDNLSTTATGTPAKQEYRTLLYPNPCTDGLLRLQVFGEIPTLHHYEIIDLQGRIVQNDMVALLGGSLQLSVNSRIANGVYILRIQDDKKQTLITEQFILFR